MLFNSWQFVIFYTFFVVIFFGIPTRWRCNLILVASYAFYMAWNPSYGLLIAVVTAINYLVAIAIGRWPNQAKFWLFTCLLTSLGLLGYFKYTNFLLGTLYGAVGWFGTEQTFTPLNIVLPVGISFFTFQALSYTMDVYRKRIPVEYDPIKLASFVAYFPQLVAGPIERSEHLLPQISHTKGPRYEDFVQGFRWMLSGALKKIVVADNVGLIVDAVYEQPHRHGAGVLTIATLLFGFQIYCDFAGYSEIARGAARVTGIDLMCNFHRPYFATSLADFWRRWHISLSTWFRDYVYLPLGGNRHGLGCTLLNTLIVFLVSGIWHGAGWNFVLWGLIHGTFLCGEVITRPMTKIVPTAVSHTIGRAYVLIVVMVAWIFFRTDFHEAVQVVEIIWRAQDWSVASLMRLGVTRFHLGVALLSVLGLLVAETLQEANWQTVRRCCSWRPVRWAGYLAGLWTLVFFGNYGNKEFIYFQF